MADFDAIAQRVAIRMKTINNEKTASFEVLKFGLLIFINIFSIIFISLLIGWMTGKLIETLLALASFALLRACTGGHHLKSSAQCIIYSSTLISIIPHIPINLPTTLILTIISMLLVLVYAPFGLENQNNIPKRFYPLLKLIGMILILINLFFISTTLAVSFFVQSVLLIRRKGGLFYEEKSSSI